MLLNSGVGKHLRVPWTARRSNQSILKEISPGCSLEGLMLKLKPQYYGHLMGRADLLEKTLMLGSIEAGRRGMTEDEVVGWHHWLNGHEFGWALGVGDGQGGPACCGSRSRKESDMTEWLNWTDYVWKSVYILGKYAKLTGITENQSNHHEKQGTGLGWVPMVLNSQGSY